LVFTNQYEQQRIQKSKDLKDLGKNPYGHNISRDIYTNDFLKKYEYLKSSDTTRDENIIQWTFTDLF